MKIAVVGGGTAGHVNAGISILDEFRNKYPEGETLFVGTKRGLEKDLIPRAGYRIRFIRARGLNRESIPVLLYSLFLVPLSVVHSLFIILGFKPDAVVGVGGFASGPFILAAAILGKPIYLLEQNAVMGFTNRILIRFAKKIFVAFPLANIKSSDAHKVVLVGNPVRAAIRPSKRYSGSVLVSPWNMPGGSSVPGSQAGTKDPSSFNIFVFGGSQGARAINNCIISAMPLLNNLGSIRIVHQTGKLDIEKVKEAYRDAVFEYEVHDYIHGMEKVYDQTDLVIARSGASTIFELIACRLPSMLIPLPTAADDHQYFNAKFLSDQEASEVIEQKDLTPEFLAERIKYYKQNRQVLVDMSKRLSKIELPSKKPEQVIIETIAGGKDA